MGDDLNMSKVHWWNHTDRGKPIALGDKSVPLSLCLPEIPHELLWDQTPAFAITGQSLSASVMARPENAYIRMYGKGKAVPLQAWSGPDGSRNLRFTDFITTAQDGGKVVSFTHRPPLPPGNTPGTHFC